MAVASADGAPEVRIAALQKDLRTKKSFLAACRSLVDLSERLSEADSPAPAAAQAALLDAGKACFAVLQARFSNPKFWQAGLDLFLALEGVCPDAADIAKWRDAAIEEVDEDSREAARQQAQLRRLQEDRKHNQGRFGDAFVPATQAELLAAEGVMLINADDSRPGMSRDAQDELRLVTVLEEETCVICQEVMPVNSKAKVMPCGHRFHDDCIISWVKKSNSCPTCRFDECPSEKMHFDDVQRRVQEAAPRPGIFA